MSNDSIYIGENTRGSSNDNQTNQIVIGRNAIGNGSNTITLGNNQITAIHAQVTALTALSDSYKLRLRMAAVEAEDNGLTLSVEDINKLTSASGSISHSQWFEDLEFIRLRDDLDKFAKKGTYDLNASGVIKKNGLLEKVYQEEQKPFIGYHGGLTKEEMLVPLIVINT